MNNSKYKYKKISQVDLSENPLITIGITCYNSEETIEKAIISAKSQEWDNYEIIVVDDCSTDNSTKILSAFSSRQRNLRVIKNSRNMGCAYSRNLIISNAKGEFIAFFDDDDFSRADRIKLQYAKLVSYERINSTNLVACFASGEKKYENGYTKHFHSVGIYGNPPVGKQMANYLLFFERLSGVFYGAGVPTCALFARKSVFENIGGFDTKMRRQEDVDFGIRLALEGGHFIGIPEPVLTQYATNTGDKSHLIEFESSLLLINKHFEYLCSKGLYHYMRMWIELRYKHFNSDGLGSIYTLIKIFLKYPFRTTKHFLYSASNRFLHEQLIYSDPSSLNYRLKCVKFLKKLLR